MGTADRIDHYVVQPEGLAVRILKQADWRLWVGLAVSVALWVAL